MLGTAYNLAMGRIVEIEVGHDLFDARVIFESCRAEGLQVKLEEFDHHVAFPNVEQLAQHRILVRPEDAARVAEIVSRGEQPLELNNGFRPKPTWMRAMAFALGASIFLPLAAFLVMLVLGRA